MPPRLSSQHTKILRSGSRSFTELTSQRVATESIKKAEFERQPEKPSDAYLEARRKAFDATVLAQHRQKQMMRPLDFAFWGAESPFIKSLREPIPETKPVSGETGEIPLSNENLSERLTSHNFRVPETRLQAQLAKSKLLSTKHYDPLANVNKPATDFLVDNESTTLQQESLAKEEEQRDQNAKLALERILSTQLSNSDQQLQRDIDRCIQVFGRHNTDSNLVGDEKFRVGRDTGSSEVQIAILTVRILNLARACSGKGRHDKSSKRHLQMFIHKRQKLLTYFKRKERGGPRYQNLINQLGLV